MATDLTQQIEMMRAAMIADHNQAAGALNQIDAELARMDHALIYGIDGMFDRHRMRRAIAVERMATYVGELLPAPQPQHPPPIEQRYAPPPLAHQDQWQGEGYGEGYGEG